MANELQHKDAGLELTRVEDNAVDRHFCDGQVAGDMVYALNGTVLRRLAIGSNDDLLVIAGGIPTWNNTLPAFTLGGTVIINGQALDAGATNVKINTTGSLKGLTINSSNASHGPVITLVHTHTTPDLNAVLGAWDVYGYDGAGAPAQLKYGTMRVLATNVTDGAEEGSFYIYLAAAGAASNLALTLSGAGLLSVDLAGTGAGAPSLFDNYDDAKILELGVKEENREMLCTLGVLEKKDSGSGYMLRIQPMLNLLAGGIYQTRDLVDKKVSELEGRLAKLELALPIGRD